MARRQKCRFFFVPSHPNKTIHDYYRMENMGLGLQLMVVGMLTVFAILLIVIYGGKLLITAVNKVAPEEAQKPQQQRAATSASIDAATMAVLQQTVAQITGGKGHVKSARKER